MLLSTLPQTERQIAREHYLEDASHDDLVSRHGISYQSVSARLFRAKREAGEAAPSPARWGFLFLHFRQLLEEFHQEDSQP